MICILFLSWAAQLSFLGAARLSFFLFLRGRIGAQTLTLGLWGSNGEVEIVLADEFAEVDEGVAHSTERGVDADACDLGYLLEG